MSDPTIFSSLLGLDSSWVVSDVVLALAENNVKVYVVHVGSAVCPKCKTVCPLYDHSEERVWRHLNTMQYATLVYASVPRVDCPEHGVLQVDIPWATPKSRFTLLFESFCIEVLELVKCQSRTAKILGVSAGVVHTVMVRAVKRGLARRKDTPVSHLSFDEKSFQKGHVYASVLCDVESRRVLDVALGRTHEAACELLGAITSKDAVKTVSMDMAPGYIKAAKEELPQARIVFDRFHVSMTLSKAVDETRRRESKSNPGLKETRYLWLKNPENLTESQSKDFEAAYNAARKTGLAYSFKELFKQIYDCKTERAGKVWFDIWETEVKKTDLSAMKKAMKTIKNHLDGVLAYISTKQTNAYAECVNSLIQEIKTIARGFRRFQGFKTAILFFLGKLDLHPRKVV